ncbi:SDR family oxidoreductase [Amnibacterium sp.]|uniref:SDR family oxidoreductase n=1 Tax=Amnibacterium sp. TaxID=1872496 RepID=UPI00262A0B47|nr:SDR family oxidoreductase [Amnibacterium sp.]MCU1474996.1 short-chain dehydrogenase [Amnibacterium sp.]
MPVAATTPTPLGRTLITGGASGLGAAVADAVAAGGGTPIVLDLKIDGSPYSAYEGDVTATRDVEALVARIVQEHGGLEAVVTAAGIDKPGRLDEIPGEVWERVIAVNLLGTAAVVRAALPALEASHGRVVTVSSSLGVRAVSDATAYSASKFGVIGFSRALAAETRGRVGVTTLIPAGMKTRFFDGRTAQYAPGEDANLNDPANVANAVVFALSSPRGSEIRELSVMHEEEPSWP